jgi:plasmid stabilization system protein ParE
MALEIFWTEEAKDNLKSIIEYLETKWTEKEIRKFSKKLEEQLSLISLTPYIYKQSQRLYGTRECLITKHNSLFYISNNTIIYILSIWDNRQNPSKNKSL